MRADDEQEPADASPVTPGHVARRRGPTHRIWDGFMADPSSVQRALLVIMSAILLTVIGSAVLMWLLDRAHYPDLGVALWWAIQTVTTVGYGDVAPADPVGRVVAGLVMLEAVAFVAIVTASITAIEAWRTGGRGTSSLWHPSPASRTGTTAGGWRTGGTLHGTHQGLPDAGRSDHALVLTKSVDLTDCSIAYARLRGVKGLPATTLGFDYRADSYCGAGSARFNVTASDGFHFVGGCANGIPTSAGTDRRGVSWSRLTFDLTDPSVAFPPVAAGATLVSVSIVQDERGTSILDNVSVNGTMVGKPGHH